MSEGDGSAVDVFLSSGPMGIIVLEVHNPVQRSSDGRVGWFPELWKQVCVKVGEWIRMLQRWGVKVQYI